MTPKSRKTGISGKGEFAKEVLLNVVGRLVRNPEKMLIKKRKQLSLKCSKSKLRAREKEMIEMLKRTLLKEENLVERRI